MAGAASPVGVAGGLAAVERELAEVRVRLREAIDDYQSLRRIEQSGDPSLRGRAAAHRDLAAGRWQAALGAAAWTRVRGPVTVTGGGRSLHG